MPRELPHDTNHLRILVVEDDPDIAALLATRLVASRYDVQVVRTGAIALAQLLVRQPDLVVLDIQLPDISGYTICQEVRSHFSRATLPVIMFTVMDRPGEAERGLAVGADAYISKRDDISDLMKAIEHVLASKTADGR